MKEKEFIMRISSIQPTLQTKSINKTNVVRAQHQPPVSEPASVNPSFKGDDKGILLGLGGGLSVGLLLVGGAAIAGIVVLPAIIGSAAVVGSGIAGATLGHKIEQKIDEMKKNK